ncbi:Glycosyl hydrolases family 43 [Cyclobacterium lianum]|uniref:Glycosyl hydrolases family 43 n=1 Tax=Cyclobacterium lianum TaxID=388280 RepID=A0A1M7QLP5_9BACT|nr:glycoside hydrolase family 43 protein [Cyclobacterium lianum]SHN31874.1 Glycosyl hydrolases family 43 [Cyclobacterium lianum]
MCSKRYIIASLIALAACNDKKIASTETVQTNNRQENQFSHPPLVTEPFTADPSAHVFEGKIYIYPSHDIPAGIPSDDWGSHFAMEDYRVYSMESPDATPGEHGIALHLDDIPWAARQLWAPDAAGKDGKYYLYFPAKDKEGLFKIGVATSEKPEGPFTPEPEPIPGTYSIDPAVFQDGDQYYLYFGGIWGGQLQRWKDGEYRFPGDQPTDGEPAPDQPALSPKVARLAPDMKSLAEEARDVLLLDKNGDPIKAGDHERRFFEAAWVHKHNERYYFSYSTGDTHLIAYATGDSPYGPFTYQGNILEPVKGWTTHHSILSFEGQWYLFYHDTEISGETHLRNIKMAPLKHLADGSIETITP